MGIRIRRLILLALTAGSLTRPDLSAQQPLQPLQPLDGTGRVTYFIADGAPRSKFRPADRDLATWALKVWERSTAGALRLEPAPETAALIRIYWVPPGAGQYGEMEGLTVNGKRGAAVYIRPDTDALGGDISAVARSDALFRDTIVYLTCLHELGHAFGLEHTKDFGSIMYYFGYGGDIPTFFGRYRGALTRREDIANVTGISPRDAEQVRTLYARKSG